MRIVSTTGRCDREWTDTVRPARRMLAAPGSTPSSRARRLRPVEGGALDAHAAARCRARPGERGEEARAKRPDAVRVEELQLPRPLGPAESGDVGHQQRLLRHVERGRVVRPEVPLVVLKVALDAHRSRAGTIRASRSATPVASRYSSVRIPPESPVTALSPCHASRTGRPAASRTVKPRLSSSASAQRLTTRPPRGSR